MRWPGRGRRLVAFVLMAVAAGCVRPSAPPPVSTDDYVFPEWEAGDLRADEARELERAWRELSAGKTTAAEKRLARLLAAHPGLAPVRTAQGFASLRAGRAAEAAVRFADALSQRPAYVPALVGAASAARRRGDSRDSLELYRRALDAAPGDALVQRRVAEVKLRLTEAEKATAEAELAAGRVEAAAEAYRRALWAAPELGALRLDLAHALELQGDTAGAIDVLRQAPDEDHDVLVRLAELLAGSGDVEAALATYRRVLAVEPEDAASRDRALALRGELERSRMPPEYLRIPTAARVTRADLAALLALKLTALEAVPAGEPPVAVDISGSWARPFILEVLVRGLLDVYPNHTFQPGAVVRRGDLGAAIGRALGLLGRPEPEGVEISDMSRRHRYYPGVSRVVAAGIMPLSPGGAFEPWRPVSGTEAVATVEAAARLVGP